MSEQARVLTANKRLDDGVGVQRFEPAQLVGICSTAFGKQVVGLGLGEVGRQGCDGRRREQKVINCLRRAVLASC